GFFDNVPGPFIFELRPDQPEPQHNELELYKRAHPNENWDAIFTEKYINRTAAEYD
ncbi:MAG: hypothetical protein JWM16_5381, partial [Verrucomicrobiales bacterium]|nr:hypothetical protein [Verrucomicrobiales bacterium]